MQLPALQGRVAPDDAAKERQRAERVADQFETLFVRTMVASLRQTASVGDGGGMFGSGPGAGTYSDWFDQNLAEQVAKTSEIGIRDVLLRDFAKAGAIEADAVDAAAGAARRAHAAADTKQVAPAGLGGAGGIDALL